MLTTRHNFVAITDDNEVCGSILQNQALLTLDPILRDFDRDVERIGASPGISWHRSTANKAFAEMGLRNAAAIEECQHHIVALWPTRRYEKLFLGGTSMQ